MQSVNSTGYIRRTLIVAGVGMFIAFLFLVPLAAFAASSTVTVSAPTSGTSVVPGAPIVVSGTVSPAPTTSTTYIVISILEPNGQTATENETAVAASTGAFSLSFTTGGPNFATNGTYTIDLNYNGATASTTVSYGSITTTTSTPTGATTTIYSYVTTTVSSVVTTATTIFSSAVSTVSAATTTTVSAATTTTIVESATSSGSGTALALGAVAIIVAIIAIILAALTMRKK